MKTNIFLFATAVFLLQSCSGKKRIADLTYEVDQATNLYTETKYDLEECKKEKSSIATQLESERFRYETLKNSKEESEATLRAQLEDMKKQREQQYAQVGDLTVLSKSANDNMNQTIKQLESKDKYIRHLMDAKSKADSLNLALAVNLKSALKDGIDDQDIDVKVDKTVVFINLSDKMLYQSGNYQLTPRAGEVLAKIATIIKSKPELEVMVEGYTDNVPIRNSCMEDNWDLSVRRSSQVVKTLQKVYGVNPDKLIAAGRGEYNRLADNNTAEGKAMNRRTRIILMPKLSQFYDLLKPSVVNAN
jgi:chemotaxis protein MotB